MSSFETALPRAEARPGKIKQIIEKIFSPRAEKTRLITLSRKRVEELIRQFPENEALLRQDVLRRFEKALGCPLSKDLNWFEVENLFEAVFKLNTNERAYQILSEGLGYPREMLTKVMHCVGQGEHHEIKTGKSTLT